MKGVSNELVKNLVRFDYSHTINKENLILLRSIRAPRVSINMGAKSTDRVRVWTFELLVYLKRCLILRHIFVYHLRRVVWLMRHEPHVQLTGLGVVVFVSNIPVTVDNQYALKNMNGSISVGANCTAGGF
jgi:hypothetical protein